MCSAHGGEASAVLQELRKTWVDTTLIVALMLDDLACDETVRFANQGDR